MTCAELEILLCDYMDGTLSPVERTAVQDHISGCGSCAQLASDVAGITAWVETVPSARPPAELLRRISRQIPGRRSWWQRLWNVPLEGLLQPRFAMGLAMTILSFSMLARLGGMGRQELVRADLDPLKLWQVLDDRTHRVWDRTVQYYDNMALVTDIQSRWNDWTGQEEDQPSGAGNAQ